jgi:hypothetical protein
MPKLYISEYAVLAEARSGTAQAAAEPALATQAVDYTAGATFSAVFTSQTKIVRLQPDTVCSVRFGGDEATTNHMRMAAGQTEYFGVQPNSQLSVIPNT